MLFHKPSDRFNTQHFGVATLSPVKLAPHSPLRRDLPAVFAGRDDLPLERFDATHLFHDVYRMNWRRIGLSGPPLANLRSVVTEARWIGAPFARPKFKDLTLTQRSSIRSVFNQLKLVSPHVPDTPIRVQPSGRHLFRGMRALTTISKNNDLDWVRDWAQFYVRVHGVSGVIIYDNNSDAYSPQDIVETLRGVDGLRTGIVVPWPYPFGMQRVHPTHVGPHSNYAQATMLEHARRRFLEDAALVINVDIDEYVVVADGRTLDEHVATEGNGVGLAIPGHWISAAGGVAGTTPRITQFRHYLPDDEPPRHKWCVVPNRIPRHVQWSVHQLREQTLAVSDAVNFRHFRAISTSWFRDRRLDEQLTPAHVVDEPLVAAVNKAFAGE